MKKAEPIIRLTRPTDISALQTLDLKSYHYPMPLKDWQHYVSGSGKAGEARIILVEVFRKPVGYCMWTIDKLNSGAHLERIGVIPQFRRNGFGRLMVSACVKHVREQYYGQESEVEIRIIVPHLHCNTDDPDDVSEFLSRLDFAPTGDIVNDWKTMYGEWVDGYIFGRKVDVTL